METVNLNNVLNTISQEILSTYKKNLGPSNIVNSMSIEVNMNGSVYEVVLNLEHYWYYIENGRRPGKMPPVEKIVDWVKRKGILPTAGKVKTQEQIGFLIARHIGKNGIKAKNTLQQSMDEVNNLEDRILEAFSKDVEIELEKRINN